MSGNRGDRLCCGTWPRILRTGLLPGKLGTGHRRPWTWGLGGGGRGGGDHFMTSVSVNRLCSFCYAVDLVVVIVVVVCS